MGIFCCKKKCKVVDFCLVYNFVVLSFFRIPLEKLLQPLQNRGLARLAVCVPTLRIFLAVFLKNGFIFGFSQKWIFELDGNSMIVLGLNKNKRKRFSRDDAKTADFGLSQIWGFPSCYEIRDDKGSVTSEMVKC